jgi:hypothetical protein
MSPKMGMTLKSPLVRKGTPIEINPRITDHPSGAAELKNETRAGNAGEANGDDRRWGLA